MLEVTRNLKPMHEIAFLPKRKQFSGNAKASHQLPVDTRHYTDLLETMYICAF